MFSYFFSIEVGFVSTFFNIEWRYGTIKDLLINEQINADSVRLIGEDGEQLGVVSIKEALEKAEDAGLDLVLISATATPQVCRIMDYGKHKFDMMKREKEAKKKQKVAEVKGMQLSMNIADNDLAFKAKNVRKFLDAGDKVKVSLRMFGRQLANPQLGMPIMDKFYDLLKDVCDMTSKPEINGRQIIMILSPKTIKK